MTTNVKIDSELWQKFAEFAQQNRTRPDRLLEKLVAEYLAIQRDLKLEDNIREQAQKSGYKEKDAVNLVKAYRQKR